jgi:hypothetical protein
MTDRSEFWGVPMGASTQRRAPAASVFPLILLALLAGPTILPAQAAGYLEDARTAKAVTLRSPRATLAACLEVLSQASGVTLTAAPALAEESLVGAVRQRPLRETMGAIAELYEGSWTALPGQSAAYRLDPKPGSLERQAKARAALVGRYVKMLDDQAAQAAAEVKPGKPVEENRAQTARFAATLWRCLAPADRVAVLGGKAVTIPVPADRAKVIAELIELLAVRREEKSGGPVLATFDLEDRSDQAVPSLVIRATVLRQGGISGHSVPRGFVQFVPLARPAAAAPASAEPGLLPRSAGEDGRFRGTRDEVVAALAEQCDLPILSRQRAMGGIGPTIVGGGRRVSQVLADLVEACEVTDTVTARGFHLFRSRTELLDSLYTPPAAVVSAYLAGRPAVGERVPFAQLAKLGKLSPFQMSIAARSNRCSADAETARSLVAVFRFYESLKPDQAQRLFSEEGLDAASLTHAQLHALLDARARRADFNITNLARDLQGLRFRFHQDLESREEGLVMEALRGDDVLTSEAVALPEVEEEERPSAE